MLSDNPVKSLISVSELLRIGALWPAKEQVKPSHLSKTQHPIAEITDQLCSGSIHDWFRNTTHTPYLTELPRMIITQVAVNLFVRLQQNATSSHAPRYLVWTGADVWPSPLLIASLLYATLDTKAKNKSDTDPLQYLLFLKPTSRNERLRTLLTLLSSPAVGVVVGSLARMTFRESISLTRAAKRGDVTTLMVRPWQEHAQPSIAKTQWHVSSPSSQIHIRLHRIKGQRPQQSEWRVHNEPSLPIHLLS